MLRGFVGFAHRSVRLWFRRPKDAFPKPVQKRRSLVASGETKLSFRAKQLHVWAAVDVKTREVSACPVSWVGSMPNAETLLRKVLEACANKPLILLDSGPRYSETLRSLGLNWRHITFGMRNRTERRFGVLKARAKRFSNNLPNSSSIHTADTFLDKSIARHDTY